MKKILLSVFTVLFLGFILNCSTAQVKDPRIQREWMLISFGNFTRNELVRNKAGINLTAHQEKGKIRGSAFMGCNNMFFSSVFKKNGKVEVSAVGGTMKACENTELEAAFSKSFPNMTKYSVKGHFLTLSDAHGNSMKFVAADWD